jgi:hypothetical protein
MDRQLPQEFLNKIMTKRSVDHYTRLWGTFVQSNGLTVKKLDGSEIVILPKNIKVIDLGGMDGNCLCGHAIRYEFWMGDYGPIGSSCIKQLTGLDGQDLRILLNGCNLLKKDREEIEKAVERYGTLDEQSLSDPKLVCDVELLRAHNLIPEEVKIFMDYDIPLPYFLESRIRNIVWRIEEKKRLEKERSQHYGNEVSEMINGYEEIRPILRPIFEKASLKKNLLKRLDELKNKIESLRFKPDDIVDFKKYYERAKNPRFIDALNVLTRLEKHIDTPEFMGFWKKVVSENLFTAITYGLSEGQISFILGKSSKGNPGLAMTFQKLLTDEMVEELDEKQEVKGPVVSDVVEDQQLDFSTEELTNA